MSTTLEEDLVCECDTNVALTIDGHDIHLFLNGYTVNCTSNPPTETAPRNEGIALKVEGTCNFVEGPGMDKDGIGHDIVVMIS